MEMIPVVSSNIESIGWEANLLLPFASVHYDVLRVKFTSGLIYNYLRVPKEVYEELMKQESKGSYIHRKIKNKYTCIHGE